MGLINRLRRATHRDHWKVLMTNILIALSGIGLFALGVNYLLTKHCFFAKTNREQYVDNVESLVNSHCVK